MRLLRLVARLLHLGFQRLTLAALRFEHSCSSPSLRFALETLCLQLLAQHPHLLLLKRICVHNRRETLASALQRCLELDDALVCHHQLLIELLGFDELFGHRFELRLIVQAQRIHRMRRRGCRTDRRRHLPTTKTSMSPKTKEGDTRANPRAQLSKAPPARRAHL